MLIHELLLSQRKGAMMLEAQEKLQKVVKGISETGKSGELVIKLKILPGDQESVVVTDDVKEKVPQKNKRGSSFFFDENGVLHKDNPTQGEFEAVKNAIAINQ